MTAVSVSGQFVVSALICWGCALLWWLLMRPERERRERGPGESTRPEGIVAPAKHGTAPDPAPVIEPESALDWFDRRFAPQAELRWEAACRARANARRQHPSGQDPT